MGLARMMLRTAAGNWSSGRSPARAHSLTVDTQARTRAHTAARQAAITPNTHRTQLETLQVQDFIRFKRDLTRILETKHSFFPFQITHIFFLWLKLVVMPVSFKL